MAKKLFLIPPESLRKAGQKEMMNGLDQTSCGSLF